MSETNTGHFVWYDLMTTDPKAAIAFYSELFGWKTQPWEGVEYTLWLSAAGPIGGTMALPKEAQDMGAPSHWVGSVEVADVDAAVARAKELGSRVFVPPNDVPKVGRIAVIADPQGVTVSLVKQKTPMPMHDPAKHGEFSWRELVTTDHAAAFAFYHDVFGWERLADMDMGPMGNYLLYGRGGKQMGGMMNKPKEMPGPSAFLFYVTVDSLDDAVARAKKLGATLLNGPMPVPGGGRIAQLMDPQGAAFALSENAPAASAKPAA